LEQQEKFKEEQLNDSLNTQVEYGITVYSSLAIARKDNSGDNRHSTRFDNEEVEDWYGALDEDS